jgi:3-hydroxyisobutyrate dehydrogenase-like beta-hydroxyacid dehydrogenase
MELEPGTPKASRLSIAIIGFGDFGQFLGQHFAQLGQIVHATDLMTDQTERAAALGVK